MSVAPRRAIYALNRVCRSTHELEDAYATVCCRKAHLIGLPAQPYDTALVPYRSVNAEGFIAYSQNFYAVPWCYIGRLLPMRVTAHEVLVYSPPVEEGARHALLPRTLTGQR